jgi:RNA polymerase sigma factor CnrH
VSAKETDNDLATRAASGDRRAYGVLVKRHAASLAQAARGFGLPETDIDDVVQEAFVAAWRHLGDYDATRSFRGWLFRIALNKMRDLHRFRRVRRFLFGAVSLDSAESLSLPDDEPDAERQAIACADLRAVQKVLDGLDRDLREAIVLTAVVGLSQPEAAAALGASVKSVEGRVARARRRLAELVD